MKIQIGFNFPFIGSVGVASEWLTQKAFAGTRPK